MMFKCKEMITMAHFNTMVTSGGRGETENRIWANPQAGGNS